jgi:hypothetical protein
MEQVVMREEVRRRESGRPRGIEIKGEMKGGRVTKADSREKERRKDKR